MFLFDTDVLSYIIRKDPPSDLLSKLANIPSNEQFTTTITVGEMVYGACRKGHNSDYYLDKLKHYVWPNINILSFDNQSAYIYGELRAELERKGIVIGEPDLRIASIAISNNLTLVSNNERHFKDIPRLSYENWLNIS